MAYKYDIFVSYKRDEGAETLTWIGDDAEVFYDIREIEAGELWNLKIRESLLRAKALIAFLTPRYFSSGWAVAEWMTFEEREHLIGSADSQDVRLILPLRMHGGEAYPEWARQRQMFDVSSYLFASPKFWESERAFELEERVIIPVSRAIHEILNRVPPIDLTWPIVDPSSSQVQSVLNLGYTRQTLPRLS